MLIELKINNLAIINNIHIHFQNGLNILSGETGAGKSVLLRGLGLLMGAKASSDTIRTGCNQASVEGSFSLKKRPDLEQKLCDLGIEVEDHTLVVRRIIAEEKSKVYLNGSLSTLNTLKEIISPLIEVTGNSAPLIEMTGQHENKNLLNKYYHLDLLDQYVGAWDLRLTFSKHYAQYNILRKQITDFETHQQVRSQRIDFLKFQRDEIKKINIDIEADKELEAKLQMVKSSAKILSFIAQAEGLLYTEDDSAISRLQTMMQMGQKLGLEAKLENLGQAKTLIEDCLYDLSKFSEKSDLDPAQLDKLEQRLSDIRKLQKKYGPQLEDILKSFNDIENELKNLESSENSIEHLKAELSKTELILQKISADLHQKRSNGAKTLANSVNIELADLNMKGVSFHISVEKAPMTSTGGSCVEYMSQSSSKEPPRPLAKVASGGELSRILLSLKRVVGSSHQPRTYLFDEVDTGVSGPTAEKVGRKLKQIAKGQQVICVTHLPQVASFGDTHFFIEKSPTKGQAQMEISELSNKTRVTEIARLISGEKITKTSLAHAEQLLKESLA